MSLSALECVFCFGYSCLSICRQGGWLIRLCFLYRYNIVIVMTVIMIITICIIIFSFPSLATNLKENKTKRVKFSPPKRGGGGGTKKKKRKKTNKKTVPNKYQPIYWPGQFIRQALHPCICSVISHLVSLLYESTAM